MTKEELKTMFQSNLNLCAEVGSEVRETINAINGTAYKLCGTMLVNCAECPELTTAIRRVHEGVLSFQEALMRAATRWVSSSPALANGTIYVGSWQFNTNMYALDAATGATAPNSCSTGMKGHCSRSTSLIALVTL